MEKDTTNIIFGDEPMSKTTILVASESSFVYICGKIIWFIWDWGVNDYPSNR